MTKDLKPQIAHIAQPGTFAPETALGYARALARPRRAGSGEDEAVAREVAGRLEQLGWKVERQPFVCSPLVNVAIALEILASLLLLIAALASSAIPAWIPAMMILLLVSLTDRIIHAAQTRSAISEAEARRPARILPRIATANLVAAPPRSPDLPSAPHLYLAAHSDSKSQFMPIVVRVALFVAALGGGGLFAALTLGGLLLPALNTAAEFAGWLALLSGAPLVLLLLAGVGNASPGAIDNASGVGTILHLAECLSAHPTLLAHLRVTILITSAEELGLLGAAEYVRQNHKRLRQQAGAGGLYILNLDGVGIEGILHCVDAPARSPGRLAAHLRQACAELGLPLRKFSLPGALFDHMPFARRGFDAVSLTVIGRAIRFVHTSRDSADKLHVRGFEQTGRAALRVMESLAGQETEGNKGKENPAK